MKSKKGTFLNPRYDLPLAKDGLSRFQIAITAILSLFMFAAVLGAFILASLGQSWQSDLQGKALAEIAVVSEDGAVLSDAEVGDKQQVLLFALREMEGVKNARAVTRGEIASAITPVLGEAISGLDIPSPAFVSFEASPESIKTVKETIRADFTGVTIRGYAQWIEDLLNLIAAGEHAALIIAAIIMGIVLLIILAVVQTRMTVLKDELEVLHLMGAPDTYIASQFARQALLLTLKGALVGVFVGLIIAGVLHPLFFAQDMGDFILSPFVMLAAALFLPLGLALISQILARFMALSLLRAMP